MYVTEKGDEKILEKIRIVATQYGDLRKNSNIFNILLGTLLKYTRKRKKMKIEKEILYFK